MTAKSTGILDTSLKVDTAVFLVSFTEACYFRAVIAWDEHDSTIAIRFAFIRRTITLVLADMVVIILVRDSGTHCQTFGQVIHLIVHTDRSVQEIGIVFMVSLNESYHRGRRGNLCRSGNHYYLVVHHSRRNSRRNGYQHIHETGSRPVRTTRIIHLCGEVETDFQVLVDIEVEVGTQIVASVLQLIVITGVINISIEQTILREVTCGEEVFHPFGTTTDIDIGLCLIGSITYQQVCPVHVRIEDRIGLGTVFFNHLIRETAGKISCHVGVISLSQIVRVGIFIRIHALSQINERSTGHTSRNIDAGSTLLSAFRRHQNYTVRTTYTIHGCGGSIFQNGYILDFIRVNIVVVIALDSVHHHQWVLFVATIGKGSHTTDTDSRLVFSRLTTPLHGKQTRHTTCQRITDIGLWRL